MKKKKNTVPIASQDQTTKAASIEETIIRRTKQIWLLPHINASQSEKEDKSSITEGPLRDFGQHQSMVENREGGDSLETGSSQPVYCERLRKILKTRNFKNGEIP